MDYRDNRQRWAESHQVVHFYASQWCTFTPALTSCALKPDPAAASLARTVRGKQKPARVSSLDGIHLFVGSRVRTTRLGVEVRENQTGFCQPLILNKFATGTVIGTAEPQDNVTGLFEMGDTPWVTIVWDDQEVRKTNFTDFLWRRTVRIPPFSSTVPANWVELAPR